MENNKICKNCGAKLLEEETVCPVCGAPVIKESDHKDNGYWKNKKIWRSEEHTSELQSR